MTGHFALIVTFEFVFKAFSLLEYWGKFISEHVSEAVRVILGVEGRLGKIFQSCIVVEIWRHVTFLCFLECILCAVNQWICVAFLRSHFIFDSDMIHCSQLLRVLFMPVMLIKEMLNGRGREKDDKTTH